MRTLFLLAVLAVGCLAGDWEVEDGVLVLTKDNFDAAIEQHEHILVEFYAPWCGHCKALAPEYAKAAQALEKEGSAIKLAKVDATEETDLAQQYDVKGYPTIHFFTNQMPKEYTGGRTSKEIVSWLKKKTGPPADIFTDADAAVEFTTKDDVVLMGFFEDLESKGATVYKSVASLHDGLPFGITSTLEVADALDAKMESIVLFKKFDDNRVLYSGKFIAEDLDSFITQEQLPLVTLFSDETAPKIFGGPIRSHFLAFYPRESEDSEATMSQLRESAQSFKGKVLFVQIDTSDDEADRIMEFFNIKDSDAPTCRLINLEEDMRKFVPDFSDLKAAKIVPWVQSYLDGNLEPHLNTEDIPDDWDSSPVKILVGKNFESIALDSTKHVFVEFYAPWCGHCKQLAPIWDELGEHFDGDEDVVIAKMDATKNEVKQVQVSGFPTLKFFTKGTNEMIDYTGGRTLDDLIEFVEAHVSGADEDTGKEDGEEEPPVDDVPKDEL